MLATNSAAAASELPSAALLESSLISARVNSTAADSNETPDATGVLIAPTVATSAMAIRALAGSGQHTVTTTGPGGKNFCCSPGRPPSAESPPTCAFDRSRVEDCPR